MSKRDKYKHLEVNIVADEIIRAQERDKLAREHAALDTP